MKNSNKKRGYLSLALCTMVLMTTIGCTCTEVTTSQMSIIDVASQFKVDRTRLQENLNHFSAKGHVFGTEEQKQMLEWLQGKIKANNGHVVVQEFKVPTPNPILLKNANAPTSTTLEKTGYNIVASSKVLDSKTKCLVLVGSHSDTKYIEGIDYKGANDSGSSSMLLLELLAYHQSKSVDSECQVAYVWFDGEEAVLPNWSDGEMFHPAKIQDNTYGSRYFVNQLQTCTFQGVQSKCWKHNETLIPIAALVLTDMVGSMNVQLSHEAHSTPALLTLAKDAANQMSMPNLFSNHPQPVEDDHIPFRKNGIAAIDLIDFNNVATWHNHGDVLEQVSLESIEKVGKIAHYLSVYIAQKPKAFIESSDQ